MLLLSKVNEVPVKGDEIAVSLQNKKTLGCKRARCNCHGGQQRRSPELCTFIPRGIPIWTHRQFYLQALYRYPRAREARRALTTPNPKGKRFFGNKGSRFGESAKSSLLPPRSSQGTRGLAMTLQPIDRQQCQRLQRAEPATRQFKYDQGKLNWPAGENWQGRAAPCNAISLPGVYL